MKERDESMTKHELFERNFDPTDSDRAMRLGYETLRLLELCQRALDIEGYDQNGHLGRDLSVELAVQIRKAEGLLGIAEES